MVEIVPSGHDDYIEWDCSHNGPITRVKSLPTTFIPKCFFNQHVRREYEDSEPAWWYSTHDQTMAAIALSGSEVGGEWNDDLQAWKKEFVTIRLVDEELLLDPPPPASPLAFTSVRALVAREAPVEFGESLAVHFMNQVVFEGEEVDVFRGWVISFVLDFEQICVG